MNRRGGSIINYPDDLNPFHSSSVQNSQKSYLDDYALPDEFPFSSSTVPVKNKVVSTYPLLTDNLPDALHPPQVSSVLSSRTIDSSFLIDDLPDSLLFHQLSRHVSSSQKSACCDECELPDKLSCDIPAMDNSSINGRINDNLVNESFYDSYSSKGVLQHGYFFHKNPVDKVQNISNFAVTGENWYPITDFYGYLMWNAAAWLGRAVGAHGYKSTSLLPCTAWNMGGPYVAANAHCRLPISGRTWGTSTSFRESFCDSAGTNLRPMLYTLGLYGTDKARRNQGISDAEDRLIDLGIPPSDAKKIVKEGVRDWSCDWTDTFLKKQENCLDLDIYKCRPKQFSYSAADPHKIWIENVGFLPSYIFGSIPAEEPPPYLRDPKSYPPYEYALVSLNRISGSLVDQVLLSTGVVKKPLGINYFNNNSMIFEGWKTFQKGGSSGSPVIDNFSTTKNRAMGSFFSGYENFGEYGTIYVSAFPKRFVDYADVHKPIELLKPVSFLKSSLLFGSNEGEKASLSCPNNFAAAGILASTTSLKEVNNITQQDQKFIGNFGLVCLPFSDLYQFDKAIVLAGGSEFINQFGDPKSRLPVKQPFDSYFIDHFYHLYSGGLSVKILPQQLAMCPPNFYLFGIEALADKNFATENTVLRGIYRLHCRRVSPLAGEKNLRSIYRDPREEIGGQKDRTPILTGCLSSDDYYITGMDLFRSSYTHGISFHCGKSQLLLGGKSGTRMFPPIPLDTVDLIKTK